VKKDCGKIRELTFFCFSSKDKSVLLTTSYFLAAFTRLYSKGLISDSGLLHVFQVTEFLISISEHSKSKNIVFIKTKESKKNRKCIF